MSLTRYALPASARTGSCSILKRNSGATSSASSAFWIPLSKSPFPGSAAAASLLVERVQGLDVGALTGRRNARRARVRQNLTRTGRFIFGGRRTADENSCAARGRAPSGWVVRPSDNQPVDLGRSSREVEALDPLAVQADIDRIGYRGNSDASATARAATAAGHFAFSFKIFSRRCHTDRMESGLHRHADPVRIGFRLVASYRHALESNLEFVLRINREIVLHGNTGARVERQIVAEPLVARSLQRVALGVVNFFHGLHRQVADRKSADSAPSRHVPLEQRWRGREHGGDVVKAVARIVDGQPLAWLDIDRQQVANGVAVFGAVQPMNGSAAGIWLGERGAIERRFEKRRKGRGFGRLRTAARRHRRHVARLDFAEHFFPNISVFGNGGQRLML